MANRDELLRAALQNAQATQAQVGYDEQYEQALALRDSQYREPNRRTGVVSPLSVLATTIRKSRGRRDERGVTGSRDANRELMGSTAGTLNQGKLGITLDKADREETELGLSKRKTSVLERTLSLKKAQQEFDQTVNKESGETWINTDARRAKRIAVIHDSKNHPWMLKDGKLVKVPDGYYPEDGGGAGGSGAFRGRAHSDGDKRRIAQEIQTTSEMRRVAGNYDRAYGQPFNDLPIQFVNDLALAFAKNDLATYAGEQTDARLKAAAQWWADWKMSFTLPIRNAMFGSQLSRHEAKSWADAELMHPGMDPDEIKKRITTLHRAAEESLLRRANIGAQDPVASNAMTWEVGLGDMYAYDFENNKYSMHPSKEELAVKATMAEQVKLQESRDQPLREVTQEEKVIYGKIVTGFDEVGMKKYTFRPDGTKRTPEEQRRLLDFLFDKQQNTLNE